jgi:hypothetical protein
MTSRGSARSVAETCGRAIATVASDPDAIAVGAIFSARLATWRETAKRWRRRRVAPRMNAQGNQMIAFIKCRAHGNSIPTRGGSLHPRSAARICRAAINDGAPDAVRISHCSTRPSSHSGTLERADQLRLMGRRARSVSLFRHSATRGSAGCDVSAKCLEVLAAFRSTAG